VALLLALTLVVGACGGDTDETSDGAAPNERDGAPSSPAGPSADTDGTASDDGEDDEDGDGADDGEDDGEDDEDGGGVVDDSPVSTAPPEPEVEPVVTEVFDAFTVPGEPVSVEVDILGLTRRAGDTIKLDFRFINLGDHDFEIWNFYAENPADLDVSGITLIDLSSDLRYLVMIDEDGQCICTQFERSISIPPGQALEATATFPAPPATTEVVDIQFPVLGVFPDVPIDG
jgi:hypothetical protein